MEKMHLVGLIQELSLSEATLPTDEKNASSRKRHAALPCSALPSCCSHPCAFLLSSARIARPLACRVFSITLRCSQGLTDTRTRAANTQQKPHGWTEND